MHVSQFLCAAFVFALFAWPARAVEPTGAQKPFDAQIQPLLKKHCFACHSGEEPKGEARLDLLKVDFADSETRDAWQALARRVEAGEMPPKGKPRPAAKEVTALVSWIGQQTRAVELARREREGRVVLRRLNRIEYQNTI